MKLKKGFTLIELLVVIAIMGVLAAIVLVALSEARKKGKDAAVVESLTQIRNHAELYYQADGPDKDTYGDPSPLVSVYSQVGNYSQLSGMCASSDVIKLLTYILTISNSSNGVFCTVGGGLAAGGQSINIGYTYEADFLLSSGLRFCVDSSGFSGLITGFPIRGTRGQPARCQ
jgi:prepilin-type N-terminal cleavage/methylation domain-containing protein